MQPRERLTTSHACVVWFQPAEFKIHVRSLRRALLKYTTVDGPPP